MAGSNVSRRKFLDNLKTKHPTWLITGLEGFLGSCLVKKIMKFNLSVVEVDNFEIGCKHNLDQAAKDANQVVGEDRSRLFKFQKSDRKVLDDRCNAMSWDGRGVSHKFC